MWKVRKSFVIYTLSCLLFSQITYSISANNINSVETAASEGGENPAEHSSNRNTTATKSESGSSYETETKVPVTESKSEILTTHLPVQLASDSSVGKPTDATTPMVQAVNEYEYHTATEATTTEENKSNVPDFSKNDKLSESPQKDKFSPLGIQTDFSDTTISSPVIINDQKNASVTGSDQLNKVQSSQLTHSDTQGSNVRLFPTLSTHKTSDDHEYESLANGNEMKSTPNRNTKTLQNPAGGNLEPQDINEPGMETSTEDNSATKSTSSPTRTHSIIAENLNSKISRSSSNSTTVNSRPITTASTTDSIPVLATMQTSTSSPTLNTASVPPSDNPDDSSNTVHQFFSELRMHTVLCLVSLLLLLLAGTIAFSFILAIYFMLKYSALGLVKLCKTIKKCFPRGKCSRSGGLQESGSLFPRCDVNIRPYDPSQNDRDMY